MSSQRGCFHGHQQAAANALAAGAKRTLVFEDDVEFLPQTWYVCVCVCVFIYLFFIYR